LWFFNHERINAMANATKYYGLCENCDHDATCTLRRSTQLKIIQCEEFSTQSGAWAAIPVPDQTIQSDPIEIARMGLCANCLNVLTCGFPNARQGVLQCEEYILDEDGIVILAQAEHSRSAA
jgi:hypothetical protein